MLVLGYITFQHEIVRNSISLSCISPSRLKQRSRLAGTTTLLGWVGRVQRLTACAPP